MDKKTKVIYICLIIFVVIVLVLSKIVDKKSNNGNNANNNGELDNKYTCKSNNEEFSFELDNDRITKMYIKFINPSTNYNYESLYNLNEYQKQEIENELLYDFGIDKFNYDGININLTYSNNLTIEINIDFSKANTDILKKMGLNYDKSVKFSEIKEIINQDKTYECK